LLRYHEEQRDIKYLEYSLNTILRAIDIINRMRYRYTSEASNFLISENEKFTFDFAENIAYLLYKRTGDEAYINQGFNINEQGRAFSLLSSIRNQRATEYGGIPVKILTEEKDLNRRLSLYEELIFQEKQLESPDPSKISNWQVLLFNAEQEYEKFVRRLEKEFPGYYSLKYDRHVTDIGEVRKKILNNTTLLEYSVLDSLLLIYYVSRDGSGVVPVNLETDFEKKCTGFFNIITRQSFSKDVMETYKNYTGLAYDLYQILLRPVEDKIHAENLIIIPDGTISYIPFDALVTSMVNPERLNYRGLPYLIKKYSAGYSYSSTLHFNPLRHQQVQSQSVLAFAPSYPKARDINQEFQIIRQSDPDNLLKLPGVKEEIRRISRIVDTEIFIDSEASERNFKKFSGGYRILHLAMHTLIDDENPMFSRLAFTNLADTLEDNLLHTYEIYNMKFNASLAVLSSCSSGYGKMQEGEGIQSLARGFAYAGCPSILMTLWEVADHSTVFVMDKFYTYLKDHDPKPIALRKAKIEFLSSADQLKSNPFFWSSYVIIGDSNPIFPSIPGIIAANLIAILLPMGYLVIYYLGYRKRKIREKSRII